MTHLLRIDASLRATGSITRDLNDLVAGKLAPDTTTHRDLAAHPLPLIDEAWTQANFTPAGDRTDAQKQTLATSDALIAELRAADTILIGLPIYNFSVPAGLKAWIDQVARAGVTFRYTENGPVGLLEGKRAILTVASGGTQAGSNIDYATTYMRHVLGFIGITDVEIVAADQMAVNPDETLANAKAAASAIAA